MKINAEWINYMKVYRLYNPKHPQDTVAYENDLNTAKKRAKEKGYDGLWLQKKLLRRFRKMNFTGKKAAAGATHKYCSRNGYGNKIQVIYNRKTDRISWYQSIGGDYMQYDNDNIISVFISKPATMEEIVNRLEEYINANVNF